VGPIAKVTLTLGRMSEVCFVKATTRHVDTGTRLADTPRHSIHALPSYTNLDTRFFVFSTQRLEPCNTLAPKKKNSATPFSHPRISRAMSDIPPSTPAATMPPGDQHCHLLDMPVEILQRITEHLDVREVIPALRQTCKSLEHATFDQFTRGSFETINCCIFYEKDWQKLQELFSRPASITSTIRVIDFTTSFLNDISPTMLQLAPNKTDGNQVTAQVEASETYSTSEGAAMQRPLNIALVARVFHDLKHGFPHILIDCNVGINQGPPFQHLSAHRDTLLTMIATQNKFHSLTLSRLSIWELDKFFLYLGPQLLQSTSDLKQFEISFEERDSTAPFVPYDFDAAKLAPIYDILRTSKKLEELYLCVSGFDVVTQPCDLVQTALEATASRKMRCFALVDTEIEEGILLKALSGWASSLEVLILGEITLTSVREGWSAVLRKLSRMPKLRAFRVWEAAEMTDAVWPHMNLVSLSHFTKGTQVPLFEKEEGVTQEMRYGREYEGKAGIVSGLEELLAKPLPYQIV
jgi:hypothetical protein